MGLHENKDMIYFKESQYGNKYVLFSHLSNSEMHLEHVVIDVSLQ